MLVTHYLRLKTVIAIPENMLAVSLKIKHSSAIQSRNFTTEHLY